MVNLSDTDKKIALGVAGAGILGTALYFLLRGKKAKMTVQYGSDVDRDIAEHVADGLKAKDLVFGILDARTITNPLVVVGGQIANPTYAQLVSLGVLPEITPEHTHVGLISVGSYKGVKVVGVAGWTKEATRAAGNYLAQLGKLPEQTMAIKVTGSSSTSCCPALSALPYTEWVEPVFIPGA